MATVETREIRKFFGDIAAVNGINLLTRDGEFLVLLGPSGCGKSTLLRMIAGFEKPTDGEVLIGGTVVNDLPPRARKIAMVFQSYALYPHMTVFKNIAFPLKAQRMSKALIPQKVDWAASLFGIGHLLARKPRELSGGERQRVALARALVRERPVLLLDEPFASLGPALREEMLDLLVSVQTERRMTTLLVTHQPQDARRVADSIVFLEAGRIAAKADKQSFFGENGPEAFKRYAGTGEM